MKKYLIISAIVFACSVVPAYAATLDLSPQTVTVAPGQTVSIVVSVSPAGATLSAIKSMISYPTNLLTPTSFTFASTWVPMTRSGYDQMTGGTVIKSAGYPGGLTNTATLGTLVFTAQSAGTATVAIESPSVAYDTKGINTLTGAQGSSSVHIQSISVTQPSTTSSTQNSTVTTAPTTKTTSTVTTSQTVPKKQVASSGAVAATVALAAPVTANTDVASSSATTSTAAGIIAAQTAAVANAGAANIFNSFWTWLVLLLIILSAGGFWFYANRK